MRIRIATQDDVGDIVAFTTGTFEWGDYVPEMIGEWVGTDDGVVMVAVDDTDRSVAMARAVFLTATEVWSHAARVHPDHRGKGIAGDLADALMGWTSDHGGEIMRLLIEDDNLASVRHITKKGFNRSVSVVRATRPVGAASPNPEGNGGLRHPSPLRARPGNSHDLVLVRSSWSTSSVGRSLRGLVATGWSFHRLRDEDIATAAATANLWEVGNSWVITESIAPTFSVRLVDTDEDEAHDVIRALIDTANNRGAEMITMWLADTDWMVQAARRTGCDVTGHGIWERPV